MKTHERTASNDPVDDQLNLEVLPENHEEKITPLPMRQMIVLSICIFGEPMSLSILFPFVYFMVESFHLTEDPKETGYYVGFVASCFSFAQFTTAVFWGWLSDKIGRRPVLLTGLIGNFLTLISFGMSKNLYWALGSRALCGFLNGNVGVAKCVLGEICDSTNQASGFAMFGLLWGIGTIAGPALGGFLADPARQFPSVFGSCEFLKQYPYFLPCFISSLISLAGFFIGYFYFEETHPKYASKKYQQPAEADIDIESESKNSVANHTSPHTLTIHQESANTLIQSSLPKCYSFKSLNQQSLGQSILAALSRQASVSSLGSYSSIMGFQPTRSVRPPIDSTVSLTTSRPISLGASKSSLMLPHAAESTEVTERTPLLASTIPNDERFTNQTITSFPALDEHNVTSTEGIGKASYLTITGYALIALHGIIFDEVYTLYCVTPLSFGGLGFSSTDIGISLAAMGVIELGTQLLIYPKLTRRMSLLSIYKIAVIIFPVVYLFFPIISSIAQAMEFGKHPDSGEGIGSTIGINDGDEIKPTGSTLVFIWSSLFVPLTLRFFATVLGYTSIMMMITNSTTSDYLGTVNGIGQTCAAAVRAVGPAIGGIMWAWSLTSTHTFPLNYYFVFLLLSFIGIIQFIQAFTIPTGLDEPPECANNGTRRIVASHC